MGLFPYRRCFLLFFFFLCVCYFSTGVAPNTSLGMIGQWFTGEAVIMGTLTGLDIQLHSIHTSCLTKSLCLYLQFLNLNIWNTRGKAPKPVFFFSIFFSFFSFFSSTLVLAWTTPRVAGSFSGGTGLVWDPISHSAPMQTVQLCHCSNAYLSHSHLFLPKVYHLNYLKMHIFFNKQTLKCSKGCCWKLPLPLPFPTASAWN